jgi:hypothetical protein
MILSKKFFLNQLFIVKELKRFNLNRYLSVSRETDIKLSAIKILKANFQFVYTLHLVFWPCFYDNLRLAKCWAGDLVQVVEHLPGKC